ncbi:MAG: hypothetical protein ACRD3O_02840 [Terriglobia bacterium]
MPLEIGIKAGEHDGQSFLLSQILQGRFSVVVSVDNGTVIVYY